MSKEKAIQIVVEKRKVYWKTEEHMKFLEGARLYGNNYLKIAEHIGSKTVSDVEKHTTQYLHKCKQIPHLKGTDLVGVLDPDQNQMTDQDTETFY